MTKKGKSREERTKNGIQGEVRLGGLLKGLADVVEKLGELAETGRELSKTGEIHGSAKNVRGIYGFTVKVGLGDEKVQVEPFGNIRSDRKTGRTVVQEVREPVVDIFEEQDHTLVVAEMPGISAGDVRLEVKDDLLTVQAERGEKKYRKEILLPESFPLEKMQIACNNGVLEIKCVK